MLLKLHQFIPITFGDKYQLKTTFGDVNFKADIDMT